MGSHASQRRSDRVIAIDGPAASGKSSVARELARRLGFIYVNSGGFYRAITWHLLQKNIRPEESDRIGAALDAATLTCAVQDNESRILVRQYRSRGSFARRSCERKCLSGQQIAARSANRFTETL